MYNKTFRLTVIISAFSRDLSKQLGLSEKDEDIHVCSIAETDVPNPTEDGLFVTGIVNITSVSGSGYIFSLSFCTITWKLKTQVTFDFFHISYTFENVFDKWGQ